MSTIRTHSLLFALLAAIGTGASAETPLTRAAEQRVDHRQDRQERRIDQGVSSGALTAPEARRLEREQSRIARAEGRAEADGKVTPREAVALEKRQDLASQRIHRQKHDAQIRHP